MGLDTVITDLQLLSCLICAILSLVAYRVRIPSLAVVPAIGFFILGFELFNASHDLLILGLFYLVAVVQFVLAFGHARSG